MSTGESDLKPNIRQMIEIGIGCGLTRLDEAYSNYLNHYDCFFYIPKYHEQHAQFVQDLMALGFVIQKENSKELLDITLTDALAKLENTYEHRST